MEGELSPPSAPKPKFSVYQNPTFSAVLTAASLRPSAATLIVISSSFLASTISLLTIKSWEEWFVKRLSGLFLFSVSACKLPKPSILASYFVSIQGVCKYSSSIASALIDMSLRAAVGLLFLATLLALIRALSLLSIRKALAVCSSKKVTKKQSTLTDRQLHLLGLKTKPIEKIENSESVNTPLNSVLVSTKPKSDVLIPIRKSALIYTPRPLRSRSDHQSCSAGKKTVMSTKSPTSSPFKFASFPATPWSRRSPGSAKGILTEEELEEYLADIDVKFMESEANAAATPPPTVSGFGIASPASIGSSTTASGAARSTPLRPVRMSPGSHQKYNTPPKKGEGELPLPMSMEQAVEAFENLGVYPKIERWRDLLRQWFSSVLINPLLDKIETSHFQVMQAASSLGATITVNQVGCDSSSTTLPANLSPSDGKEWQPTVTLDEDGFLQQMHTSLEQARDGSMWHSQVTGQRQSQQITLFPLIQQCVDAITEHQRLKILIKGELIKGLLHQSTVPSDYTAQRVRELAEGTCLKNFYYTGNGEGYGKKGKKWTTDVPSDSHLLLYLFCAFLEHPKWMLHVDPTSYSGIQSSKNPLFLGVLPPKDRFPEKYVAVISGVPSIIHPGACVLSIGKQRPPIFALYWDKKLQFSLQGRTALWDAILLLSHRIKVGYGGVVRGVHLGSAALNIIPILDSETDS